MLMFIMIIKAKLRVSEFDKVIDIFETSDNINVINIINIIVTINMY